MKKHYQKYCMHFAYAIISTSSFLFTTRTFAQETTSFTITSALLKSVMSKYDFENFKVYRVISKEVEYYPYIDKEIVTTAYQNELNRLERYKPAFDEYNSALKLNEEKKEAVKTISQNIESFLASDEKYEVKEKLLIESQSLADRHEIKVQIPDDKIKLQSFLNTPNTNYNSGNSLKRIILIHEQGKKSNKNDLRIFKDEIQKIKISEPEKTNNYREYLELLKELSTIPKTETGKVLSDKISKKSVYVITDSPIEINVLSGVFTELPESYLLIKENVTGKFIKNELFTKSNEHYDDAKSDFYNFPIIQKSGTDELYYIMSNQFISQLKIETNNVKFAENENQKYNTIEYRTWKAKYIGLLQSAQVNVNSCNAIIKKHTYLNRLDQKRYDSNTFTKQEKITFNKNLDLLNDKLKQIGDLEDQRDFLLHYNDKVSNAEAVASYNLSTFYNTTNRAY